MKSKQKHPYNCQMNFNAAITTVIAIVTENSKQFLQHPQKYFHVIGLLQYSCNNFQPVITILKNTYYRKTLDTFHSKFKEFLKAH